VKGVHSLPPSSQKGPWHWKVGNHWFKTNTNTRMIDLGGDESCSTGLDQNMMLYVCPTVWSKSSKALQFTFMVLSLLLTTCKTGIKIPRKLTLWIKLVLSLGNGKITFSNSAAFFVKGIMFLERRSCMFWKRRKNTNTCRFLHIFLYRPPHKISQVEASLRLKTTVWFNKAGTNV